MTGDLAAFVSSFLPKEYQNPRDKNHYSYLKCTPTLGSYQYHPATVVLQSAQEKKLNDCIIAACRKYSILALYLMRKYRVLCLNSGAKNGKQGKDLHVMHYWCCWIIAKRKQISKNKE